MQHSHYRPTRADLTCSMPTSGVRYIGQPTSIPTAPPPNSELYGNGATPKLQPYTNLNGVIVNPQNTDWEKEIHRTALMQTYSIGISKGDENGSSSLSVSWLDHDGIIKVPTSRKPTPVSAPTTDSSTTVCVSVAMLLSTGGVSTMLPAA